MKKGLVLTIQLLTILVMLVPMVFLPATASAETPPALYSRTITVNTGQVPSTQTDFPLLVSLSNTTLRSVSNGGHVANTDGSDIYFTDVNYTTQYPCEIESYNSSTGALVAWVKVPSLSDGTVIRMWYGIASSTPNTPSNVWDSSFKGVWHMNQVNAADSTANANNGTAANASAITLNASGKIDGSDTFTNFGNNESAPGFVRDYMDCGNGSSLSFSASGSYTWEAWVYLSSNAGAGAMGIFGKATASAGYEIYSKNNGNTITIQDPNNSSSQVSSNNISYKKWHQMAVVYNDKSISIYIDGSLNNSGTLSTINDDSSSNVFMSFRRTKSNGAGLFNGSIDEVRYSTAVRSANWITTEYNNQNNPSAFYTLGAETPTHTISVSAGANGAILPSGNVPVGDGANETFEITPDAYYQVADVLADNISVGAVTSYTFTNVTANHIIAATFSLKANSQTRLATSIRTSTYGQSVTLTATVSSRSGTPTGTVTFKDGATIIAPNITLVGNSATFTTSALTTGSHAITAVYNGDGNFNSSTSSTRNQRVSHARTATSVTSSSNPSNYGDSVTFTVTVTVRAPGSGTPTGMITFKERGSTLYTVALNGSGQAAFTTSSLSVGRHKITAVYSGDSEFIKSTSAAVRQQVQQPTPTPTPTPTPRP